MGEARNFTYLCWVLPTFQPCREGIEGEIAFDSNVRLRTSRRRSAWPLIGTKSPDEAELLAYFPDGPPAASATFEFAFHAEN